MHRLQLFGHIQSRGIDGGFIVYASTIKAKYQPQGVQISKINYGRYENINKLYLATLIVRYAYV
jgi:hypothetical protein